MNVQKMGLATLCRAPATRSSGSLSTPLFTMEAWILLAGIFGGGVAALYGLGARKPLWMIGGASTSLASWLIGRAEILGK